LGDGTTNFVRVTDGRGSLLVTTTGLAGQLAATVDLSGVPGATFSGSFGISLNTTGTAVAETFNVAGDEVSLTLPAGPYLRVEGLDVQLAVLGQSLRGDFAFEQLTREGGGAVVRLAVNHARLAFSDGSTPLISLSEGRGSLLIQGGATPAERGLAGELSGQVSVAVPGLSLSGALTVQVNDTPAAIDEAVLVGDETLRLVLPAGRYLRFA